MTQSTNIPSRCLTFQIMLMDALEATWAVIEDSFDSVDLRLARDKAKAIGDLAAMARKIALIVPVARPKAAVAPALAELDALLTAETAIGPLAAPMAAQAEHARRALDKLKGGRRGPI
jgi:hypothetical protein